MLLIIFSVLSTSASEKSSLTRLVHMKVPSLATFKMLRSSSDDGFLLTLSLKVYKDIEKGRGGGVVMNTDYTC